MCLRWKSTAGDYSTSTKAGVALSRASVGAKTKRLWAIPKADKLFSVMML